MEGVARLAKKHNLIVLSDEVYEWMTYDDAQHIRMATLPDMWERTITLGTRHHHQKHVTPLTTSCPSFPDLQEAPASRSR
jgi:hypothetical protein